jgi:hypothetical protein
MTKNQKLYLGIGGGVVALALVMFFIGVNGNSSPQLPSAGTTPTNNAAPDAGTFSGTISSVDTGCLSSGACSITIDGKKVVISKGGQNLPSDIVGKLTGVNSERDLADKIGSFANVHAGQTPTGDFTIYGNNDYFVDVTVLSGK